LAICANGSFLHNSISSVSITICTTFTITLADCLKLHNHIYYIIQLPSLLPWLHNPVPLSQSANYARSVYVTPALILSCSLPCQYPFSKIAAYFVIVDCLMVTYMSSIEIFYIHNVYYISSVFSASVAYKYKWKLYRIWQGRYGSKCMK
jgi:hypothetical protein